MQHYGIYDGKQCVIDFQQRKLEFIEQCCVLDSFMMLGEINGNYMAKINPILVEPEQLVTHCLKTATLNVQLYTYQVKRHLEELGLETMYQKYVELLTSTPVTFDLVEERQEGEERFLLLTPDMIGFGPSNPEQAPINVHDLSNFHLRLGNGLPFLVFDQNNDCVYQLAPGQSQLSCIFSGPTYFLQAYNNFAKHFKEINQSILNNISKPQKMKQMDDLYTKDSPQLDLGNRILIYDCIAQQLSVRKTHYFENINVFIKLFGKLYMYIEQAQRFLFGQLTVEYAQMQLLLLSFLQDNNQQILALRGEKCCVGYFQNGSSWLSVRQFLQSQCQIQLLFVEDFFR